MVFVERNAPQWSLVLWSRTFDPSGNPRTTRSASNDSPCVPYVLPPFSQPGYGRPVAPHAGVDAGPSGAGIGAIRARRSRGFRDLKRDRAFPDAGEWRDLRDLRPHAPG